MIANDLNPVTGPIYIATLLLLSVLTLTMTVIVYRAVGAPIGLSWLTATVLALSFLISLVNPQLGLCSLLLLIVAGPSRHATPTGRAVPSSDRDRGRLSGRADAAQPKCAPPVTGSGDASASSSVNGTALPMNRRIWLPVISRYGNMDPAPRRISACSGSGPSDPVRMTLPNRRPFSVAGSAP